MNHHLILDRIKERLTDAVPPLMVGGCLPTNLSTEIQYSGTNLLSLWFAGGSSPYWCTFKQALSLGARHSIEPKLKGAKGWPIIRPAQVIPRSWEKQDGMVRKPNGVWVPQDKAGLTVVRLYYVFNALDIGLDSLLPQRTVDPVPLPVDDLILNLNLQRENGKPCYYRDRDVLSVPARDQFVNDVAYMHVVAHELVHATMAPGRLDRVPYGPVTKEAYDREELVAEIGAVMLCAHYGHDTSSYGGPYIRGYMQSLDDGATLIHAAAAAQKAVSFILGGAFQ